MTDVEHLLTTAEAAEILRLSQPHLEKMRVYGRGPRFVRLGRAIRYRRRDLLAWIEVSVVNSTSEADAADRAA